MKLDNLRAAQDSMRVSNQRERRAYLSYLPVMGRVTAHFKPDNDGGGEYRMAVGLSSVVAAFQSGNDVYWEKYALNSNKSTSRNIAWGP